MIAINYQKETSHIKENISQRKNYHIKYYHSWGVNLFDLLFIMHESILLETATLVIYIIWAYGAHFIHFMIDFSISCHVLLTYLIMAFLKCPTLWLPKLGYHNTFLPSASVPDTHNMLVVFVVGSPFWRYLIFISFKPMRSIHIKYLYSIIFNIRALICLIWCLYNNGAVAFCDFMC